MRTNYLNFRFVIYILLTFITVSSCSKEEEESDTFDLCDRLDHVLAYKPYPSDGVYYTEQFRFSYDEFGRLKTANGLADGRGIAHYTYHNDRIVIELDFYGKKEVTTFNLKNKRISDINNGEMIFSYDSQGYLISYKSGQMYDGKIWGYSESKLEYTDGNLTRVYTLDPMATNKGFTFTYYDEPAQDVLGYLDPIKYGVLSGTHLYSFLISGEYFGKRSKNLMKSSQMIEFPHLDNSPYHHTRDKRNRITSREMLHKFHYACE